MSLETITVDNEKYLSRLKSMKNLMTLNQQDILYSVRVVNKQDEYFYNKFVSITDRFSDLLDTYKNGIITPYEQPSWSNFFGFFDKRVEVSNQFVKALAKQKNSFDYSRNFFLDHFNPEGFKVKDSFKELYKQAEFDVDLDLSDERTFDPNLVSRFNSFYET